MRDRYQKMIDHANEAVLVAQDGLIKFVNPAALELFGFPVEEYEYSLQQYADTPFVEFIHPDDRNLVFERHLKRLKGDTFENVYVFRIIDRNGGIKWLEINVATFEWDGNQATLNFLKDVSDRVLAEEALRQRNLELELLNRVGNTLISNLDLNQLLITILEEVRSIRIFNCCINPHTGCQLDYRYCYASLFMRRYSGYRERWREFVDVKVNTPELLRGIVDTM